MTVLLGTTNPSKTAFLAKQLEGYPVEFCTLTDLGIQKHPDEDGKSPVENARIKAAHYGKFHDPAIAEDSALYIRELPWDDPRQPGLSIRRAADGRELDEDGMLHYYAQLARSLGGRVTACYVDGYAVCRDGAVSGYMADEPELLALSSFWLVDKPHPVRHPGWPLDSISIDPQTGLYFTERARGSGQSAEQKALAQSYRDRLREFYIRALGL